MATSSSSNALKDKSAWQATAAEFIATLLFVFLGAGTVVTSAIIGGNNMSPERLVAIALAHGLAIAVLVAATARVSGGHINPAVTVAAMVTRKMSLIKGLMYIVGQLVGAVVGAYLLAAVVPADSQGQLGAHALGTGVAPAAGLVAEMVVTFALVFVVFATAMDPAGPTHLAPFAIGITVLVDHLIAVPLTGASMNPARSFGPALAAGQWTDHWVYWIGPLAGGIVAGVIYQALFTQKEDSPKAT